MESKVLTGFRGVLAVDDDDVGGYLFFAIEPPVQNIFGTRGIAFLGIDRSSGYVGGHSVTATERVLRRPPWVANRCGLDIPDITGIA